MSLKIYNTRTRQLEELIPLEGKGVGFYACGPTVYAPAHIGNLRSYIFEDILRRTLEVVEGYTVKHVVNITDVGHLTSNEDTGEDRMELGAAREGLTARAIADKYEALFKADLKALNITEPTKWMRATDHIGEQIELIQRLEEKKFTYRITDGIYFDTSQFPHYGELEPSRIAGQKAGARVEENSEKKNPQDFALWKFSPHGVKRQMEWPSPWGVGFPGWHIECSAMAMAALGEQFDLHAGGIDHIPVHHTNEIAQSEAATGKHPFVKYWVHGEFLELPGKRMGKSEGNAILISDLVQRGIDPLAFRYLVLTAHYRTKLQFSWEALEGAAQTLHRVRAKIAGWKPGGKPSENIWKEFRSDIESDLNTPAALSTLHTWLREGMPYGDSDGAIRRASFLEMDRVLGLNLDKPAVEVEVPSVVRKLVNQREEARKAKNFAESDRIRKQITDKGFAVEDTPSGPKVRPA